jgi:hypothetical protein
MRLTSEVEGGRNENRKACSRDGQTGAWVGNRSGDNDRYHQHFAQARSRQRHGSRISRSNLIPPTASYTTPRANH